MMVYEVGFGCYEDTGSFGTYSTMEKAEARLAVVLPLVGKDNGSGDTIQRIGIYAFEIDIDRDLPVWPEFDEDAATGEPQ